MKEVGGVLQTRTPLRLAPKLYNNPVILAYFKREYPHRRILCGGPTREGTNG